MTASCENSGTVGQIHSFGVPILLVDGVGNGTLMMVPAPALSVYRCEQFDTRPLVKPGPDVPPPKSTTLIFRQTGEFHDGARIYLLSSVSKVPRIRRIIPPADVARRA